MTKHTPAALALALGLLGATTLMAQAPTHDVDAVTELSVVQATPKQAAEAPTQWARADAR